jgi:hypothetical protein
MVDICAFRFELQRPLFFPGNKSLCFPHAFAFTHFNTSAPFLKENHNHTLLSAKDALDLYRFNVYSFGISAQCADAESMQYAGNIYRDITVNFY